MKYIIAENKSTWKQVTA